MFRNLKKKTKSYNASNKAVIANKMILSIPTSVSPSFTILALPKSPIHTRASCPKKQLLGLMSP